MEDSIFGLSEKEIAEALAVANGKRESVKGLVCICGHPAGRHIETEYRGEKRVRCTAHKNSENTSAECPCKAARVILKVEDSRGFLRKTMGAGALHALVLGIASSRERVRQAYADGKRDNDKFEIEWLIDLKCDKCGTYEKEVLPCPVSDRGVVVSNSAAVTLLLCKDCRVSE